MRCEVFFLSKENDFKQFLVLVIFVIIIVTLNGIFYISTFLFA